MWFALQPHAGVLWRTVRHQGIWLKEKHLKRLFTSHKLHAHTVDACVEAFFASLKSWRERRKTDPNAKPPHKRRWYFRIEYKRSAMSLVDGKLRLSNGRGNVPLILDWRWDLPQTIVIHWTGTEYEAIATYKQEQPVAQPQGEKVAGIDLGEVHMAVAHDGTQTHILNGRLLRSKVQYRNKLQAELNSRIDGRMKKGSRRRKRLIRSKKRQLKQIAHQIQDIEHKQTTRLITTLHQAGVQHVRSKVKGRVFRCPKCHWSYHRDGVGAVNIRHKYLGQLPVVGAMAPPMGIRFRPHTRVAREQLRENVCPGNSTEAARL